MIENKGDRARGLNIPEILLVLDEVVGNHVRNGERTVVVAFFPDHFVQLPKQRLLQGNAESCNAFFSHDVSHTTTGAAGSGMPFGRFSRKKILTFSPKILRVITVLFYVGKAGGREEFRENRKQLRCCNWIRLSKCQSPDDRR
jgi:hypothetical protein